MKKCLKHKWNIAVLYSWVDCLARTKPDGLRCDVTLLLFAALRKIFGPGIQTSTNAQSYNFQSCNVQSCNSAIPFSAVDHRILAMLHEWDWLCQHPMRDVDKLYKATSGWQLDRRSLIKRLIGGDSGWRHELWPEVDIWHSSMFYCLAALLVLFFIRGLLFEGPTLGPICLIWTFE